MLYLFKISRNLLYCAVPEIIDTHPIEGYRKFLGGVGGVNILEAKYEAKLEIRRGGGGGS